MNDTINLTEIIFNSINELFSQLFSSIDNTIYSILDELIFINNVSTDNSLNILKEYAEKDNRFTIIKQENRTKSRKEEKL